MFYPYFRLRFSGLAVGKAEWWEESEKALATAVRLKPGIAEAHQEWEALFTARKEEEKALQEFRESVCAR